jgi:hypothetical protein
MTGYAIEPSKTELAAARDLFSRAERDEDAGRWSDAVDKLRRAGTVKMTPGIRFHIALCEEKLGQLVAALADYAAAEAAARAEGNKDVLDAIGDPLAALRARIPTITITLAADARGTEVTLDGLPLASGLLGTPVPVDVGSHTVQGHAVGKPPFSKALNAVEKQASTVEVTWVSVAPAGFPVGGGAVPLGSPPAEQLAAESSRTPGRPLPTAAVGATVGAAALVGFGVLSYFIAGGKQSAAETQCLMEASCDNLKGGVRTWDALALTSWIAGGAAAALSVYLWTRPVGAAEKPAPAAAALVVGPGGIRVRGEF